MGMPSCSACVFMCVSMPACASCFVILGECVCVSIFGCVSVCYLILYVHAFYYIVSIKNVFAGMYSHEYNPVCMTEHTHTTLNLCVCVCVCVWIYSWEQCYLVRCFPHYFSGKWAISHIAWSLIVSLCKSIQELQLKCSLMWYNWCLPNPLFAHLPVSLNF